MKGIFGFYVLRWSRWEKQKHWKHWITKV